MGKRLFLFVLGLSVAAMGALFIWLMARSYQRAVETRSWEAVPALVLESRVQERQIGTHVPVDYAPFVLYGYEYKEQRYTSQQLTLREAKWAKERERSEKELEAYRAGQEVTAYVNPERPAVAILAHDTKAAGYSIWFPALFLVGGLGIMVGAFLPAKKKTPPQ